MTRECHVRFCERLRGKFLRSTHHFGMKAHIGTDRKTKLIHSVVATAANVHDSVVLGDLLHGEETKIWGDSAYHGKTDLIAEHAPSAKDLTQEKGHRSRPLSDKQRESNRKKSSVWSRVEHSFFVMKRQFGFTKVRWTKTLTSCSYHAHW